MEHGASQLMVYEIAEALRSQEKTVFNLGGADRDQAGLIRFKVSFGATDIPLETTGFYLGGRITHVLTRFLRRF